MPSPLDAKAEEWAKACLKCIGAFEDDRAVDRWVELQAQFLWRYKKRLQQSPEDQLEDYLTARAHFAYLVSDAAMACHQPSSCICELYSSNHFRQMQSLTLERYLQIKSYLRWTGRTDKLRTSTLAEAEEDYNAVLALFREMMGKCSWCQYAPRAVFWKNACSQDVISRFNHMVVLRIGETSLIQGYPRYVTSFLHGLHALRTGEEVAWNHLAAILWFLGKHPFAVSMFEVLLVRAMLADHFGRLYSNLLQCSIPVGDLVEPQAWYFWFLKGCPEQTSDQQRDDYQEAKRYLAFVLSKHVFARGAQLTSSPLNFATSKHILLLQSLSLREYLYHDVVARQLENKRRHLQEVKIGAAEIETSLADLLAMARRWSGSTPGDVRAFFDAHIRPHWGGTDECRRAKFHALRRMGIDRAYDLSSVERYLRDLRPSLRLPRPIYDAAGYVNMLEFAVGSSLEEPQ